jgi:hypothetical protein
MIPYQSTITNTSVKPMTRWEEQTLDNRAKASYIAGRINKHQGNSCDKYQSTKQEPIFPKKSLGVM